MGVDVRALSLVGRGVLYRRGEQVTVKLRILGEMVGDGAWIVLKIGAHGTSCSHNAQFPMKKPEIRVDDQGSCQLRQSA